MKLTFWGAAQQVTGSMFLLELEDDFRILIDCGSDLEGRDRNAAKTPADNAFKGVFPFEVSMVNVVLLTHAHIDHSGNIPNLYREGYEGQVLCTDSTAQLTHILLNDSARLNQRKISDIGQGRNRKGKKREIPRDLFVEKHVREAMENVVSLTFNRKFKVADNCHVTFFPAGHLLGAAHIVLEVRENGQTKTICFSGDVGRKNYPLLIDPHPVPACDYLVCESTYGNRYHNKSELPEAVLENIIRRTCIDKPGRLIIPAFSVGRTQALLFTLNKIYEKYNLPPIKIFSDSPLALESSKIYQRNVKMLNKEAKEFNEDNESLFDFENLVYLESNDASRAVANYYEPCVIISSSGMVQGGRIEYHIAQNISNSYATVLMIGYCAEGTLGWRLMNGQQTLRISGHDHQVNASIEKTDAFSGHADCNDLVNFVKQQNPETLKTIFLVHGESQSMTDFKETLSQEGFQNIEIPVKGQRFEL